MARTLLVVPTAAGASLARTCLGVVRALDRRGVHVGFVKPVAQPRDDGGPDRSAALVRATSALRPPEPLSTARLEQQLGSGALDVVLEKAVAVWQPVHDQYDVVVVEGLSPGPAKLYASGLNQALARALDADVLLAVSWLAADAAGGGQRGERTPEAGPDEDAGAAGALAVIAEDLLPRRRPAGTHRVSMHAWSAVWSTACQRRRRLGLRSWARRWPSAGSGSLPRCRTALS